MICLASVGALSLARMAMQALQTWLSGGREHQRPVQQQRNDEGSDAVGLHVRREAQEAANQPEQPV